MGHVQTLLLCMVESMGLILRDPIFYFIALTVIFLYKREIRKVQRQMDEKAYSTQALKNIGLGLLIGVMMSGVLQGVGVKIEISMQVILLIPIAIGLMLIDPKYGCFSYVLTVAFLKLK